MPDIPGFYSKTYVPHPVLQPYIKQYLFTSISTPGAMNVDLFPVGHAVISFALNTLPVLFEGKDALTGRLHITGQLTRHFNMAIQQGVYQYVYVLFKPFGAYRLLGFPQHTLNDNYASLLDINPGNIRHVYNKMIDSCYNPALVINILEAWFLQQWQQVAPIHKLDAVEYACEKIMEHKGAITAKKLYREVGMSKSSIERHFKEKIGLTPKMYNRVVRFNNAYQTIQQGAFKSWQDIVYDYGYFDQAHFIKEFKAFYGYTPSQLHLSLMNIAGHVTET